MNKKTEDRIDIAMKLGLKYDGEQFTGKHGINLHWTDITCMSDEEFNKAINQIKKILKDD